MHRVASRSANGIWAASLGIATNRRRGIGSSKASALRHRGKRRAWQMRRLSYGGGLGGVAARGISAQNISRQMMKT